MDSECREKPALVKASLFKYSLLFCCSFNHNLTPSHGTDRILYAQ